MKGRNGPTFLPLSPKIGGPINENKPSIGQCLIREQANLYTRNITAGIRTQKAIK